MRCYQKRVPTNSVFIHTATPADTPLQLLQTKLRFPSQTRVIILRKFIVVLTKSRCNIPSCISWNLSTFSPPNLSLLYFHSITLLINQLILTSPRCYSNMIDQVISVLCKNIGMSAEWLLLSGLLDKDLHFSLLTWR